MAEPPIFPLCWGYCRSSRSSSTSSTTKRFRLSCRFVTPGSQKSLSRSMPRMLMSPRPFSLLLSQNTP